jgi:hypothetical protein
VRWWRKSPGSCSSLLVCLSLALLSLPTGKSASSTAVSTNTISSLPYPAGGLHPGPSRFCASSLRLIQRVAIHEKYVGPPVVVIIKILTPLLPVVSINYFFDSTPPFPLSVRSPACCATSMNPRLCADRVASSPRRISSITISGGGIFADVIADLEAVARSIAPRCAGQTATARVCRVAEPNRFVALIEGRSGTPHGS